MLYRPRTDDDLAAVVALARQVHDLDGYPVVLADDPLAFLVSPDALGAWVAEEAGAVVGHVALHLGSSAPVVQLAAAAAGCPPSQLGVVARLLVAPTARRRGIGRGLLGRATDAAVALGRRPVLDVVTEHRSAIHLYDRCGWQPVGTVTVTFPEIEVTEIVYLAPAPVLAAAGGGELSGPHPVTPLTTP